MTIKSKKGGKETMTSEKLFSTLKGCYHDGLLLDAKFIDGKLYMYCFRNPPDREGKEDPNTRYVIIRFDDVTDLHVFDWRDTEEYLPYTENSFIKVDGYGAMSGIYFLSFNDGMIEFEECVRFRAKDVTLLAFSHNELDFSKYC